MNIVHWAILWCAMSTGITGALYYLIKGDQNVGLAALWAFVAACYAANAAGRRER